MHNLFHNIHMLSEGDTFLDIKDSNTNSAMITFVKKLGDKTT